MLNIEKEMLKISEENLDIVYEIKSREDAIKFFKKIGEEYLEDNIPHVKMILKI